MREFRSSGSVEGVKGNHDSYSDFRLWRPSAVVGAAIFGSRTAP